MGTKKRSMTEIERIKVYKWMEKNIDILEGASVPKRTEMVGEALGMPYVSNRCVYVYSKDLELTLRTRGASTPPFSPGVQVIPAVVPPEYYVTRDEFVKVRHALAALILELGGDVPPYLTV